jgi:hypothetical protein
MTPEQLESADGWARRICVWLWWIIIIGNFWCFFKYKVPWVVTALGFFFSFVPHIVYNRWLSPRLTQKTQ